MSKINQAIERVEVDPCIAGSLFEDTKRVINEGDLAYKVVTDGTDYYFESATMASLWMIENI